MTTSRQCSSAKLLTEYSWWEMFISSPSMDLKNIPTIHRQIIKKIFQEGNQSICIILKKKKNADLSCSSRKETINQQVLFENIFPPLIFQVLHELVSSHIN